MPNVHSPETERPFSGSALPRRVGIFIPSFRGGGAERAMILLADELQRRGIVVDLLVVSDAGPLRKLVPETVKVVLLGRGRVLTAIPSLVRYVRGHCPDVLYSTMGHCNLAAILAGLVCRQVRVVIREANSPSTSYRAERFSIGRYLTHRAIPLLYPAAHRVVAVSQEVARQLCELGPRLAPKIVVLPTPVISNELDTLAAATLADPWFEPSQPPVIIGVGRLHPQKDFSTLLRAFAQVRKTVAVRLVILGEGSLRDALIQESDALGVTEDVSFPGFVDNPFAYIARSKVFVLSSRYEGMPNVLIQAMALGIPVIASDCPGGSAEVLDDGRLGRLVPVGEPAALATAISEVLASSTSTAEARATVRRRYSVESSADAYLAAASG
ncbi:MAG: glycosyltransferase [Bdellovibrionales bacterium]|nr:glycosyltransferase [Bdellovibrionales bacterium]